MKRYLFIIFIFINTTLFAGSNKAWESPKDSIKKYAEEFVNRVNMYRFSLHMNPVEYVPQFNKYPERWAQDFIENRNPTLYYTMDFNDSRCTHYKTDERVDEFFNSDYKEVNKLYDNSNIEELHMGEIVNFGTLEESDILGNVDLLAGKSFVDFKKSPAHNEIMKDRKFKYCFVGIYLNVQNRKFCLYAMFF